MAARGAQVTLVDVPRPFAGRVERVRGDVVELARDPERFRSADLVHGAGVVEECAPEEALKLVRAMGALSRDRVLVGVPNFFNPYLLQIWRRHGKTSERYLSRRSLRRLVVGAGLVDVTVLTTSCLHPRLADSRLARSLGAAGAGFLHVATGRAPA
jgi:hypothetical protein